MKKIFKIFLGLIFLTSIFLTGFFIYQNKKLANQLTECRNRQEGIYNPSLTSQKIDEIIEKNTQTWKLVRVSSTKDAFSFMVPTYMSRFEYPNTDLQNYYGENVTISRYYRSSNGNQDYARSFLIFLHDPYTTTISKDIPVWIKENGKDQFDLNDNKIIESEDIAEIKEISVDGRPAFSVVSPYYRLNDIVPKSETIYFSTLDGIRSIGFKTYTDDGVDYKLFHEIISTLKFEKNWY